MPEDVAHPPTRMLGPSHLLRREHQQLLDKPACGLAHQLVDARARVLDEIQHWQQHLALIGEGGTYRASNVVLSDDSQSRFPTSGVSRTILHGGFPFLEFLGRQTRFSRIHQENRRPQPSTTAGTPPSWAEDE